MIPLYRFVIQNSITRFLLNVYHPDLGSIVNFVIYSSQNIHKNETVLDAGAGSQNYKPFFKQQNYVATDFVEVDKVYEHKENLDFICDLHNIPKNDSTYDAIVNLQVLEHVRNPQQVINEFHRVLKKGGQLFLTAPQGWGLHDEPHHYFNFTRYGLEELFIHAGFKIKFIKERGGYFSYLTVRLQEMPFIFISHSNPLVLIFGIVLAIIPTILFYLITPPIFYIFDRVFDRARKYTLGYACHCIK
jgi:SAM-dependent methyltransferase